LFSGIIENKFLSGLAKVWQTVIKSLLYVSIDQTDPQLNGLGQPLRLNLSGTRLTIQNQFQNFSHCAIAA
jgi:hypothetical protein